MALPGINTNRKRFRNTNEDECSEFTPLSKRINNLHLNNTVLPLTKHLTHGEPKVEHKDMVATNERLSELQYDCGRSIDGCTIPPSWQTPYSPDLTPTQNPFYYESNRLLYQLYIERMQRNASSSTSEGPY